MRTLFALLPFVLHSLLIASPATASPTNVYERAVATAAIAIEARQATGDEFPFAGDAIYIRQQSPGGTDFQALVTNFSGGNDAWFDLPESFDDPATSKWSRSDWELVGIRRKDDPEGDHHGLSINANNTTVYVTVRTLNTLDVVRVDPPPS
ncbi:hypothetical protein ACEPAH_3216 [Sanghuangporus vaninii]